MRHPYRRSRLPRLLASTSRPRCSHSRMKSSSNPLLRFLGQSRRFVPPLTNSGLPPTADITHQGRLFRKVPTTDKTALLVSVSVERVSVCCLLISGVGESRFEHFADRLPRAAVELN
jgi:hypothetical protein